MDKCYVCTTGKLIKHGCFVYCDTCTYSAFSITDDYISSCAALVGTMVSNTVFKTSEAWSQAIGDYMAIHLPVLTNHVMNHITDDRDRAKFMVAFSSEVLKHSINLEVPPEVGKGSDPKVNTSCVGCGNTVFSKFHESDKICTCERCGLNHRELPNGGLESVFMCNCGSLKYHRVDELISECNNCGKMYVGTEEVGFRPI